MPNLLMPDNTEISALLALLLLIDARAPSRLSPDGHLLLLSEQDCTLWDTRIGNSSVGRGAEQREGLPTT